MWQAALGGRHLFPTVPEDLTLLQYYYKLNHYAEKHSLLCAFVLTTPAGGKPQLKYRAMGRVKKTRYATVTKKHKREDDRLLAQAGRR